MNNSKDISIDNINVSVPNKQLLINTKLKVSYGRKYALIGHNGLGKSTLLKQINEKILPIPTNIDIFYVDQEIDFDGNETIYNIVLSANRKRNKLMKKLNSLEEELVDEDKLNEYNQTLEELEKLDYSKDESMIRKILYGLGFESYQQDLKYNQFSGGWKMRVALARGLYMRPTLLMLDEPTNHLDLNTVIWLTDYLSSSWKKTLIVVSHDINFINSICTDIIHLENKQLNYYKGNYYKFRQEYEKNQRQIENDWNKIQNKIKEMRKKSTKKEIVDEFIKKNKDKEPIKPYRVRINFKEPTIIKWPALFMKKVTYGYSEDKFLLKNISLKLSEDDKITIVGKNGVGKSTLLKLLAGEINDPLKGEVLRNPNLKIGYYTQHMADKLPLDKTPIQHLQEVNNNLQMEDARKLLGTIGLEGKLHHTTISLLSGGQKARVLLATINAITPHVLLLDEPTNHLDIESIDALIEGINNFKGPVIVITHNIELISKTECRIMELVDQKLHEIDFDDYYEKVLGEINS